MIAKLLPPLIASAALMIGVATADSHPVVATAACVRATIGDRTLCLIAGRPCRPRYERQYERHGFKCKRNAAGEYRLWQPITAGQPRP
jgi:hypothetical protein